MIDENKNFTGCVFCFHRMLAVVLNRQATADGSSDGYNILLLNEGKISWSRSENIAYYYANFPVI